MKRCPGGEGMGNASVQEAKSVWIGHMQSIAEVVKIIADGLKGDNEADHGLGVCVWVMSINRATNTVKGLVFNAGQSLGTQRIRKLSRKVDPHT
jgi:hypothetical protein